MPPRLLHRRAAPLKIPFRHPTPFTLHRRLLSSSPLTPSSISALLSKPTWSLETLHEAPPNLPPPPEQITQKQLHHLLRLSALPLPTSPEQEAKMISELQDQLRFVRAVQSVDTEGVEPLRAIRDETEAGRRESEVTLETLRGELEKEEVVGFARRIRRKKAVGGEKKGKGRNVEDGEKGGEEGRTTQGLELLKQAPEKRGRYVVVNTAKS